MYHTCRWCKHYENGCCTNENIFDVDVNIEGEGSVESVDLVIKEPESFYCKEWE
jgi:hypothetical protein